MAKRRLANKLLILICLITGTLGIFTLWQYRLYKSFQTANKASLVANCNECVLGTKCKIVTSRGCAPTQLCSFAYQYSCATYIDPVFEKLGL